MRFVFLKKKMINVRLYLYIKSNNRRKKSKYRKFVILHTRNDRIVLMLT